MYLVQNKQLKRLHIYFTFKKDLDCSGLRNKEVENRQIERKKRDDVRRKERKQLKFTKERKKERQKERKKERKKGRKKEIDNQQAMISLQEMEGF